MRKMLFGIASVLALAGCSRQFDKAEKALPAEIQSVIENYAGGSRTGDVSITKKAFADGATISWKEGDSLRCVPIQSLYDYVIATGKEEVIYTVEKFSVAGSVAVVYISSQFGATKYDDMFTLVNGEDGWKIVSKVYSVK